MYWARKIEINSLLIKKLLRFYFVSGNDPAYYQLSRSTQTDFCFILSYTFHFHSVFCRDLKTHTILTLLPPFDKKLFTFNYFIIIDLDDIIMDAARQLVVDRKAYLLLARNIIKDREANLRQHDREYRARRLKLLYKIYLSTRQPQLPQKRRRLLLRIGPLTKVTFWTRIPPFNLRVYFKPSNEDVLV